MYNPIFEAAKIRNCMPARIDNTDRRLRCIKSNIPFTCFGIVAISRSITTIGKSNPLLGMLNNPVVKFDRYGDSSLNFDEFATFNDFTVLDQRRQHLACG